MRAIARTKAAENKRRTVQARVTALAGIAEEALIMRCGRYASSLPAVLVTRSRYLDPPYAFSDRGLETLIACPAAY